MYPHLLPDREVRQVRRRRAFTLVEILIVVAIMGILLAVAVPQFQRAGNRSRARSCQASLKQIAGAKERWAMDGGRGPTDTPNMSDLAGPGLYLKAEPKCPAGGTYTLGNMSAQATCSIGGTPGDPDAHAID